MSGWSSCALTHPVLDPEEIYGLQEVLHWTEGVRTFRGRDPETSTPVVAKVMGIAVSDAQGILRRVFLDRAAILGRLQHHALPHLRQAGLTPEGDAFLIFDWSEGVPVSKRLPMDPHEAFPLLVSALEGVECLALHSLVHWNLTPSNVLVLPDGGARLVGIGGSLLPMEWWEQHRRGAEERERYMAPELLTLGGSRAPAIGGAWWRCDLYSLAQVACDVVGAVVEGAGTNEPRVHGVPGVDRQTLAVLESCLRADPDQRPASIAEVMRALQRGRPDARRLPPADPGDDLMSTVKVEGAPDDLDATLFTPLPPVGESEPPRLTREDGNPFATQVTGTVQLPDRSAATPPEEATVVAMENLAPLPGDATASEADAPEATAIEDEVEEIEDKTVRIDTAMASASSKEPREGENTSTDKTVPFEPRTLLGKAGEPASAPRLPFPTLGQRDPDSSAKRRDTLPISEQTVVTEIPGTTGLPKPDDEPSVLPPTEKTVEDKGASRTPSGRYPMAVPDPPTPPALPRVVPDETTETITPLQSAETAAALRSEPTPPPKEAPRAGSKETITRAEAEKKTPSEKQVPPPAAAREAAGRAPASGDAKRSLPLWGLAAAVGVFMVLGLVVFWLLSRGGDSAGEVPAVVADGPRVAAPEQEQDVSADEFLAVEDPVRWPPALEEALALFAEGQLPEARELLVDLEAEADAGEIDPRVCEVLNPIREAVMRALATDALANLEGALSTGDLAVVRTTLESLGPEERARLAARPGGTEALEAGGRAVLRVGKVLELIRTSKHAEALVGASELRGSLAVFERKLGLRERAAKGLEREIDDLNRSSRFDEAERRLSSLLASWPDRAGASARQATIQRGKNSSQRWQQLLASARRTLEKEPHQGINMLSGVTPPAHMASQFAQLKTRLESEVARRDERRPTIELVTGAKGRFARGSTLELVLDTKDDYLVTSVAVFGRSQIHVEWQALEIEQSAEGQYVVRVPPSFHGDRDFEIWGEAFDFSGNRGTLASKAEPLEIERKRWWR